jgi:hypothetical protein
MTKLNEQLKNDILNLIKVAVDKATGEEEFERQGGKVLFDGRVSRLIYPPSLAEALTTISTDLTQETS